jgi:hypothetical protein
MTTSASQLFGGSRSPGSDHLTQTFFSSTTFTFPFNCVVRCYVFGGGGSGGAVDGAAVRLPVAAAAGSPTSSSPSRRVRPRF